MTESTSPPARKLLLLTGAAISASDLLAAIAQAAPRAVASIAEARALLHQESFDFVAGRTAELFPPDRLGGAPSAESILRQIDQGICVLDREGRIDWSNEKLQSYPPEVAAAVSQHLAGLVQALRARGERGGRPVPVRRTLNIGSEYGFDLVLTPLRDAEPTSGALIGLVWDVSDQHRLQDKLDAIEAAGRELMNLDTDASARLEVGERLQLLEDRIIRYCRDLLRFEHFAVRVLDQQTNRLDTVLAGGFPEEARSAAIFALPEHNGISGYVAATGQSYLCPDVSQDPRYLPGIEGARSSLTVPLRLLDRTVGILNVESDETDAFSDEDRQIAEIFGRYIASALQILRLLAVERFVTTGQIASDVSSELAAPLNDIVSEVTCLLNEYAPQDGARRRLQAILASVDRVKRTLTAITANPGITGLLPETSELDPVLDGKRILIAEDEDIIRDTVADVLTKAGAITITARDGEVAIAMLAAQRFDLVLSDIKMPFRSGYDVFAATRTTDARCPVILITGFGYDPEHNIVRASREGLAGVLFKPFKVDQLKEAVRNALEGKSG